MVQDDLEISPKVQRLRRIRRWSENALMGTSAIGIVLGGPVAWHYNVPSGHAGPAGPIIDLEEDNGMLLRDMRGRPAFVNYFDSMNPEDMELTVSLSTALAMPDGLQDHMSQITRLRQKDVSFRLDAEDYRPLDSRAMAEARAFFAEFEELTGIRVHVVENDADADIVIAGYDKDMDAVGFASFPQEMPFMQHLPQDQGYMMLDVQYLRDLFSENNPEAVRALISHEFGHNLGLLHPHDDWISTAMSETQEQAVARMSYNNHVFPPVAETTVDTGYGPLDIFLIREALREMGVEPPAINAGDQSYLLTQLAQWQRENTRAKTGTLNSIPALSLLDSGGQNQLHGTDGDDMLVTESGYCGLVNRDERQIEMLRDGQLYCLVEGEFSVVRSGGGDDLILTANGTEQQIYLGTGDKEVAMVHEDIGDKTITAEDAGMVTLTLHPSLFRSADAEVTQDGADIVVRFYAPSGRETGSLTLVGQAEQGGGIDRLRVIDDTGETRAEYDVSTLHSAEAWQEHVISPINREAHAELMLGLHRDVAHARQGVAREYTSWAEQVEAPHEHGHGDAMGHAQGHQHRHAPAEPQPTSHAEAVLNRRREESEKSRHNHR